MVVVVVVGVASPAHPQMPRYPFQERDSVDLPQAGGGGSRPQEHSYAR